MRKFLIGLCFLLSLAFAIPCYASQSVWKIIDVTLDNDPVEAVSANIDVRSYSKVGFVVSYNETETGGGVSALVNITINPTSDVGTPASGYFYDFVGGTTLQTSETISADGEYYFWFPEKIVVPFVQVTVTGTAVDANDIIALKVYLIGCE